MELFLKALEQFKEQVIDELEQRLWERLEPRIQQTLYGRHMTIGEAARYLRVSDQTVRRMLRANELPYFRVRQQIFIRQVDVDEWVDYQIQCSKEN